MMTRAAQDDSFAGALSVRSDIRASVVPVPIDLQSSLASADPGVRDPLQNKPL
jgi:hypothetical protein